MVEKERNGRRKDGWMKGKMEEGRKKGRKQESIDG